HAYHSSTTPAFTGSITVQGSIGTVLGGPPGDLASVHIPDLAFPPTVMSDLGTDPHNGLQVSRTRVLVGFNATATVAQANAALARANVSVIGGLPRVGIALVAAPSS